jgi:hypothetical protein
MGSVRMFRDRVVSMEQTQELGEKHIELLNALAMEALPGFALGSHGLDHERDHYWLSLTNDAIGQARRVVFTRMFLSDSNRLPAVVADPNAPVRAQIVACIRDQAARAEILVTVGGLLTEEERLERDEIEAEWRKKHEAEQAVRRAEEERRARERQRLKQLEEARRHTQRERERRERAAAGQKQQPQPGEGGGKRRRRRGRGGAGGIGGGRPSQSQPAASVPVPRPPQPPSAPSPEASRAEGAGGRRRRRRGRGRGQGGQKPPPPSGGSG